VGRLQLICIPLDSTKKECLLTQFRVLLRGHLPPAPADSEVQARGSYVTRLVTAMDPTDAGSAAIQVLQAEPKYQRLANSYPEGAPELAVEEVSAAPESHAESVNRSGYVFFEDE
jgi:hypothetical protein